MKKPALTGKPPVVAADGIESMIFHIRGNKVMLDQDLAKLYGITTGVSMSK